MTIFRRDPLAGASNADEYSVSNQGRTHLWHRGWCVPIAYGFMLLVFVACFCLCVTFLFVSNTTEQEAQLLQRDRATLRVVEYFVKSLKITGGHLK